MLLLRYYLWIVPHLICGTVALVALRKKIHKDYPAFVSLMAFAFVFELWVMWAVALAWRSPSVYKWCAVVDVVIAFLLQVLVLQELVGKSTISRMFVARLLRPLPRWTAAITVLLAVLLTAFVPQTAQERVMNAFLTVNLGLNIVAAGLLLAMLLFARVLDVQLPNLAFGIALGIGITATVEIGISPLMSLLGRSRYITLDLIRMVAFHISAVVWLVYILLPENSPARADSSRLTSDLEMHLEVIERIVQG